MLGVWIGLMNLKELHIKLDALRRAGKGHLPVYFTLGGASYPILDVYENSFDTQIPEAAHIRLDWIDNGQKRRDEAIADGRIGIRTRPGISIVDSK
jgi:hypothetical protein